MVSHDLTAAKRPRCRCTLLADPMSPGVVRARLPLLESAAVASQRWQPISPPNRLGILPEQLVDIECRPHMNRALGFGLHSCRVLLRGPRRSRTPGGAAAGIAAPRLCPAQHSSQRLASPLNTLGASSTGRQLSASTRSALWRCWAGSLLQSRGLAASPSSAGPGGSNCACLARCMPHEASPARVLLMPSRASTCCPCPGGPSTRLTCCPCPHAP